MSSGARGFCSVFTVLLGAPMPAGYQIGGLSRGARIPGRDVVGVLWGCFGNQLIKKSRHAKHCR